MDKYHYMDIKVKILGYLAIWDSLLAEEVAHKKMIRYLFKQIKPLQIEDLHQILEAVEKLDIYISLLAPNCCDNEKRLLALIKKTSLRLSASPEKGEKD